MSRLRYALLAAVTVLALSGCSDADDPDSSDVSETSSEFFVGTPEEYTVLVRTCLDEKGFLTADNPGGAPDGFAVAVGDHAEGEVTRASEECRAELGEPQMSGLPEDELRTRYDARVAQWECLVENDLVSGDPISFEVFVEDYNRSGQESLWEPTESAQTIEFNGIPRSPTDVCPRVGAW